MGRAAAVSVPVRIRCSLPGTRLGQQGAIQARTCGCEPQLRRLPGYFVNLHKPSASSRTLPVGYDVTPEAMTYVRPLRHADCRIILEIFISRGVVDLNVIHYKYETHCHTYDVSSIDYVRFNATKYHARTFPIAHHY